MSIADEIQTAIKAKNATIGYRESMKIMKSGGAKTIIMANNLPDSMDAEIKHNAKVAEAKLEVFDGGSKDLGTACGKPFPVAVVVIKD